jgi:REP element-mobilizing transposase RayT
MSRHVRLDFEGAVHHVMTRGIEKRRIFLCREDREDLLARICEAVASLDATVYAWALMPNHYHLLVRTGTFRLPRIMSSINTGYVVTFNRRHDRIGHLFQNRYKSRLVQEDFSLLNLVRYILLNPIKAGIIDSLAELAGYEWTGYSTLTGNRKREWQNSEYVLSLFGSNIKEARRNLYSFLNEEETTEEDICDGVLVPRAEEWVFEKEGRGRESWGSGEGITGDHSFIGNALNKLNVRNSNEPTTLDREPLPLTVLADVISRGYGILPDELEGGVRTESVSRVRSLFIWAAIHICKYRLREIAVFLGLSISAISQAEKRVRAILFRECPKMRVTLQKLLK